jgi:hypothetical protein
MTHRQGDSCQFSSCVFGCHNLLISLVKTKNIGITCGILKGFGWSNPTVITVSLFSREKMVCLDRQRHVFFILKQNSNLLLTAISHKQYNSSWRIIDNHRDRSLLRSLCRQPWSTHKISVCSWHGSIDFYGFAPANEKFLISLKFEPGTSF